MLRDDIVTLISNRFNFRDDLDTKIVTELKNAQIELEEELVTDLPWFLLSEVANIDGTASEERIPLPSDFLQENEDGTLWRYDAAAADGDPWKELRKGYHDALKAEYTGTGAPIRYALLGKYFRIYPTPDISYNFRMLYYKRDSILESNIENEWLKYAPWLIGARTGFNLAHSLRDNDNRDFFATKYTESLLSLEKKQRMREETNFDASIDDMDP